MTLPADMSLPLPTMIGIYPVTALLAAGPRSCVYAGRDPADGRSLALKTSAGAAALAAGLVHPHIVAVLGGGRHEGQPFVAMELVAGPTLRTQLEQGPPVPAQALAWMRQLLAALQHMHERDVVHQDIKPANLLLTAQGQLKVADFGLAARSGDRSGAAGTPAFMAPERMRGAPADARADLYAAGAMLYQLLTGCLPFAGGAGEMVSQALAGGPLPPSRRLATLGPRYDALLARALAGAPEARFQSAAEFAAALDATSGGA